MLVWLNRLHKTVCVAGCRYLSDIVDKMHSGLVWSDLISTAKLCTLFIYKRSPAVLIWLQISDFQWEDATIFQTCWYSPQSRKPLPEDEGGLPYTAVIPEPESELPCEGRKYKGGEVTLPPAYSMNNATMA